MLKKILSLLSSETRLIQSEGDIADGAWLQMIMDNSASKIGIRGNIDWVILS